MPSPIMTQRRARVLQAARRVFLKDGLRAATMEAIAAEAGMAKATLYRYLPDKEAAFAAVADGLAQDIDAAFHAALTGPDPLPGRIARALVAKHRTVTEYLGGSQHAAELLAARAHVAEQFRELDARLIAALGAATSDAQLARILFGAAAGLAAQTAIQPSGPADMADDIARLVAALVPDQDGIST